MHELSIAVSIVDICSDEADKAGASRVSKVELDIGSMSGVETDALEFAWEAATQNTIAAGAILNITHIAAMARCRECGHEFGVNDFFSPCPECSAFGYEVFKGRELKVRAITVD